MVSVQKVRKVVALLLALAASVVDAHEGHQPLPTKGVQVDVQHGRLTLSAQARNVIGLQSAEVVVGPVASKLRVYAEAVTPWHAKAFGSAQIAGRIVRLLVAPGDRVAKNQIVAELTSRDLELVKLEHLQADSDLRLNLRLLETTRSSAPTGSLPMQRLLEIENAVKQSQNRLEVARIRAQTLGVSLTGAAGREADSIYYPIRSPIAGLVHHLDLAEGKYVEAYEHLFEIVNTDEVWVRLQLLEKDFLKTEVGNRVKIDFPSSSISVEGVIVRLDAGLDPKSHVSYAWVTLTNSAITPGQVGRATIYTSEQDERLTVPQAAVYSDGLQHYVFVEEASTRVSAEYRKKAIRLGGRLLESQKSNDCMIEVLSGDIYPGDRIVVQGGHELSSLFFLDVLKLSVDDQQRLGIRTAAASYREIATTLQLPASVTLPPENRSVLSSQVQGTIHSHLLLPGRTVKAGETLMEISSPDFYRLQLDLISASLDAELAIRRADWLESVKGDVVSNRLVLEARAQAEQLEGRASSLRRQLTTLGLEEGELDSVVRDRRILEYLPIRSKIEGRITSSVVTLGETVVSNQPLVEIQNLDSVWIEANVPSHEARFLSERIQGIATLLANPEFKFSVVLARLGPIVNESTRTRKVWLTPDVNSMETQLRAGTLIKVNLPIGEAELALAIPSSAILREGMHYFSFIQKNDGYIERRRLTIGRSDGVYTEIVSGIEAGEFVVTAGGRELQTAFASLR